VHEAYNGDAVLLEDEEFAVHVRATHYLAEIHARFGQGKAVHDGFHTLINVNQYYSIWQDYKIRVKLHASR
jgi:hypothetical protein